MKPRLSIRTKLFLSILLILLASYSALLYTTVKSVNASLEAMINKELEDHLNFAQNQYLARADQAKYALMYPASAPPVQRLLQNRDREALRDALMLWRQILPFVDILNVVDPGKRVLARVNSDLSGDGFEIPAILERAFREREPVVSTELVRHTQLCREGEADFCAPLPPDGEALVVLVAVPVIGKSGEVLGGIIAGDILNRDPYLPYRVQEIFGRKAEVTITQRGLTIASSFSGHAPVQETIAPEILERLERGLAYRGDAKIGRNLYKTAFEPIKNIRGEFVGSLSVAISKEDFKRIRRENLCNIFNSWVMGILLSFAMAYLAARRLTAPFKEITRGAQKIATGDLQSRVEVDTLDEFGALADSFNRMAESLEERDGTIRKKTADMEELNFRLQELNELLEKRVAGRTAELQMEKGRLEAILTSMAEGVVVTDRENRVILLNPAAQRILELVPHRVVGKPFKKVCESSGICPLGEYVEDIRRSGSLGTAREVDITVKGKKLKVSLSPLLDQANEFAGVVMSFRDVTIEEEVDRMKTEFISAVSHELKTPLTSIKGSLQLIMGRGESLTPTERELLEVCLRNTDRLMRLISDILDISKIEAGRIEFTFKPHSVSELVAYSVEEMKSFAESHHVSIVSSVGTDLPPVYADHDRLIQVIANLLSNAVKSSPEGGNVEVTAHREGDCVAVSVADRGKAIDPADRPRLFQKFQQIGGTYPRDRGGTGLGLAISKEIIEKHHGRISYSTAPQGGNVFTFTVPVYEEAL